METLATRPTAVNADAVAFCPYPSREHLVACGCYELDSTSDPPTRSGSLVLYSTSGPNGLDEVCKLDDVGVLDCTWLPQSAVAAVGKEYLAVATSDCSAELYCLKRQSTDDAEPPIVTEFVREDAMPCADAGHACMGLAWSAAASEPQLALSGTTGRAFLGQLSPGGLQLVNAWQAHDLECWAVAFGGAADPATLFTGGDDATLKRWDLRTAHGGSAAGDGSDSADPDAADDGAAPPVATAMNRRSHAAGVCCIAPCPSTPHLLATGSYDERARLWDARMLRAPLVEHECGGGVWRLKWHPERRDVLLAACMHAGFAVLRVPGLEQPPADAESTAPSDLSSLALETAARYEAHGLGAGGLGYGADWAHRPADELPSDKYVGATASFYDRQMHLWSYSSRGS